MSDKKNQVVPAKLTSSAERMLAKLASKNSPGIANPEGKNIGNKVAGEKAAGSKKKATRLIRCSTHTTKGCIVSMYLHNDTAHIYAKDPTTISNEKSNTADASEIEATDIKLENGITMGCMTCSGDTWFACHCGTYSCLSSSSVKHTCPSCHHVTKRKNIYDAHGLSATTGSSVKGTSQTALPKGGSGLYLGNKEC